MGTAWEILLTILIVVVMIGWFSLYGPMDLPENRENSGWVMPGDGSEQAELAVPGAGTLAVTVTETVPVETQSAPEITQEQETQSAEAEDEGEPTMDNTTELIWYVAGVVTFLIGEITGPLVAGLWKWVRGKRD